MRTTDFFGLGICVFSLFFAYYFLELYLKLDPCPLCILDRFVVGFMGVVFAAGLFVDGMRGRLALLGGNLFFVAIGFVLTGRHVWLQNQPLGEGSVCLAEQEQIEGFMELIREA
ncbi:MAG: disulfide bond formation protein B, partial [Betaproteobacteria bacterium AqS2]|nr:disulfide bond formation protein B [Betaproteobacteria bacterium AqS2]